MFTFLFFMSNLRFILTADGIGDEMNIHQEDDTRRLWNEKVLPQNWKLWIGSDAQSSSQASNSQGIQLEEQSGIAEAENISQPVRIPKKDVFWTDEKNNKIVEIFYKNNGDRKKIFAEWIKDRSNHAVNQLQIYRHINNLMRIGVIKSTGESKSNWTPKRSNWNDEMEMNLMKIWNRKYLGRGEKNGETLYREWKKLYPHCDIGVKKLLRKVNILLEKGFTIRSDDPEEDRTVLDGTVKEQRDIHRITQLAMQKQMAKRDRERAH